MAEILGEPNETLEAILVRRREIEQTTFPDLRVVDEVVLKNGPKAYKVATHWEIVDRHTGELHHHSIRITTYRRLKPGWILDSQKSVILEEEDGSKAEASRLATFIATALQARLPTDAEDYVVVPVAQTDEGTSVSVENFRRLMQLCREGKSGTVGQVLEWIAEADAAEIVERLSSLNVDGLRRLNTIVGVSALKAALDELRANLGNAEEEYWQDKFSKNWYILSQVFAYPVVILKGKAYVGGKGFENTGGNIVDFLAGNGLTKNAVLIEIKTPVARLLGGPYRSVFSVSAELSGAVLQVSNYKQSLMSEFEDLRRRSGPAFRDLEAFDPKCLVVIGNGQEELTSPEKAKSFELFRSGLNSVQVVTFDELLSKVENLIRLLEEGE